eukprot:247599_1
MEASSDRLDQLPISRKRQRSPIDVVSTNKRRKSSPDVVYFLRFMPENPNFSKRIPRIVPLNKAEIVVGRDSTKADVVLESASMPRMISRTHAKLIWDDQQNGNGTSEWRLVDCASLNGAFVNGHRIAGAQALNPGDRLRFGGPAADFNFMFLKSEKICGKTRGIAAVNEAAPGELLVQGDSAVNVQSSENSESSSSQKPLSSRVNRDRIDVQSSQQLSSGSSIAENSMHEPASGRLRSSRLAQNPQVTSSSPNSKSMNPGNSISSKRDWNPDSLPVNSEENTVSSEHLQVSHSPPNYKSIKPGNSIRSKSDWNADALPANSDENTVSSEPNSVSSNSKPSQSNRSENAQKSPLNHQVSPCEHSEMSQKAPTMAESDSVKPGKQELEPSVHASLQAERAAIRKREAALAERERKIEENDRKLEEEWTCCICQDLLLKTMSLKCGHVFCEMCLDGWLKTNPICPTCRVRHEGRPIPNKTLDNTISHKVDTLLSADDLSARKEREIEWKQWKEERDAAPVPPCPYGAECYRRSEAHRIEFSHPPIPVIVLESDTSDESSSSESASDMFSDSLDTSQLVVESARNGRNKCVGCDLPILYRMLQIHNVVSNSVIHIRCFAMLQRQNVAYLSIRGFRRLVAAKKTEFLRLWNAPDL